MRPVYFYICYCLDLEKRENAAQQEKESDIDASEKLAAEVCFPNLMLKFTFSGKFHFGRNENILQCHIFKLSELNLKQSRRQTFPSKSGLIHYVFSKINTQIELK